MSDEQQLIERIQSGDRDGFREIVEMHKRHVFYLALDLTGNTADAEDISQEVFVRAFRSIGRFRGEAKISSWLYRITVNCCIDHQRRRSMITVTLSDNEESAMSGVGETAATGRGDSVDVLAGGELQADIERGLKALSPRERTVFVLRHYQELQLREIGELLDIAEGTVKALLFRAIRRLQKVLAVHMTN